MTTQTDYDMSIPTHYQLTIPIITFTGAEPVDQLFRTLASWTCPHGFENLMYGDALRALGWQRDSWGNFSLIILNDDDSLPSTAFTAHMDTISYGYPAELAFKINKQERLAHKHGYERRGGVVTKNVLGADDKAGMTVLLKLAHYGLPGHYFLFVGEEHGRLGSTQVAAQEKADWSHLKRMISFDRRGYTSVITHQNSKRCCSPTFAHALATALNTTIPEYGACFRPDSTGSYTDSASFLDLIPECTNISVGYFDAHTSFESQDTIFLAGLIDMCACLDWDALPTERDPNRITRRRSARPVTYRRKR